MKLVLRIAKKKFRECSAVVQLCLNVLFSIKNINFLPVLANFCYFVATDALFTGLHSAVM